MRHGLRRSTESRREALLPGILLVLSLLAAGCRGGPGGHMMARKPDYSKLALRGNGHTQDSFSLAVQAAAGLLGRDADYETIYCLSSNAFAPAIDTAEDCTAWWHVNAALGDRCMQTVARRLGLAARRLPIPELAGHWSDADAVARQRRAGVEVLKEAMDRGEVIVTLGGWQARQDDRFVPWCWAGVLTEVNYDGTIRGACLNGRQDDLLYLVPSETWALSAADVTLTEQEAGQAALTQAVARIRGDTEPFLRGDWYVYGMKAMDAWIEKMEQTPFCVPCFESAPDRVWTCAINNAQTTTAGAKAAALHLRERLDTFPEAAHSHLEAAATHYDRIAEVLGPALTGEGGEHYRDFIGDLEKQKAHADVLRRVKAELAAAADEMERALAAARVEREGGKVWIEGLERLEFGKQRDSQFFAALTVAMRHMGEKTDYDQLMGYSAAAFRLSVWDKELCPSSPDALGGFNHALLAAKAFGYSFEIIDSSGANEERKQELRRKITACIDAGIPVVANSLMGHGSYGVIAGYEDEGRLLHCRVYDDVSMAYTPSRSWPWKLVFLQKEQQHQDADRSLYRALKTAVELAHTEGYERDGELFSGFAAYRRWVSELTKDDMFRNMDRERRLYFADSNGWMYLALADARGSAARSLYRTSNGQNENTATHLANAAQAYEAIHQKLLIGQKHAPLPWQLAGDSWVKRVPHPKTEENIEEWSKEMRHAQADVLRECLALEKQAIVEIEKALATMRVQREGDRLVLKGFPTGTDYQIRGFGELLALRDCLAFEGVDVDWNDLLGYSGDAFGCDSMHYYSVRTHDVLTAGARAFGFNGEWSFDEEDPPFASVRDALASGRPVTASGGFGTSCLYFPVVIGEDRAGARFLVAGIGEKPKWAPTPAQDGVLGRWNGQSPWATGARKRGGIVVNWQRSPRFILKGRAGRPTVRERLTNALRLGVASYRAAPLEMHWGAERWTCALGRGYLAKWPNQLRNWARELRERGPVDPNNGDPPRPGYFNPIAVSVRRRAAAAFLRKHETEMPSPARPHLEKAAEHYDDSVRAAESIFERLYAVEQVRDSDWYGKLCVRFYLGEGKGEAQAVAQYAKDNPELFAARAAVTGRISQTFADDAAIEEACRLAGEILKSDDAAIAQIERALAAEYGQEFTGEQLKRLKQWGNMWGDLDGCIRAAGREPTHFELLRTELALEPISVNAREIRNRMGLEPADLSYPAVIEALLHSIATGKVTEPWPPARTPERLHRLKGLAGALRAWSDGASKQEATKRQGTDAPTVEEVYGYLAALDEDKKAVVALLIEKVETGYSERAVQLERKGLEDPETLEEALAHNVSMCDTQCWTFEHNLRQLLQRIGSKTMRGGWSEPDGPIGWSGPRAMDPEYKPRLGVIVAGLEAWLAGEAGEDDSRQIVEMLGARDAYNEKEWLVRCLHNYLSHHARGVGY